MRKIEPSENASPNGRLTLEDRRANLEREIRRLEAMLLKMQGAKEMVDALIKEAEDPPPEAA